MKILITGSAGYIGSILVKRFLRDNSSPEIVGADLLEKPDRIPESKNLSWIKTDLAKDGWQPKVLTSGPIDVVVHAAFKIRNPYGREKETYENNLSACKKVFEFCLTNKIPKLVYLSSVAAYGTRPENIGILLKEEDPLREDIQPYGAQKKAVEKMFREMIASNNQETKAVILRLNSVTGPFGQSLKSKFGLITFLKKLMPFLVEVDASWARQFVHEDDVEEVIARLASRDYKPQKNLDVYNIAPEQFLTARDMSKLLHKKVIHIPVPLAKFLFGLAWHTTLGKIPTAPVSVNGLIYPINVNGKKIEEIGFHYHYTAEEAFLAEKGFYSTIESKKQ